MPESSDRDLSLEIIRIALILGVVVSGVVFWVVLDRMGEPLLQPEARRPVRLGLFGFWALVGLAIAIIDRKRPRGGQRARALTILGWALAEAMGLAGVVYFFLTGAWLYLGMGLGLQLVISFLVLNPPSSGA
jgi:hypothetical protein